MCEGPRRPHNYDAGAPGPHTRNIIICKIVYMYKTRIIIIINPEKKQLEIFVEIGSIIDTVILTVITLIFSDRKITGLKKIRVLGTC